MPAGTDQYNVCLEVAALEWILHVVTPLIEDDANEIIRSEKFCNTALAFAVPETDHAVIAR